MTTPNEIFLAASEQLLTHREQFMDAVNNNGFTCHNGIRITRLEQDYCEGELDITPNCLNYLGIVHGGCLAALADTVGGMAAISSGRGTVTLNYGFSFLRQAKGKKIRCVATPEKVGKSVSVFRCVLTDDEGKTVASGQFTFHMFDHVPHLPNFTETP